MYRNFYTTAMCPQKKVLAKRFENIEAAKSSKKYVSVIGVLVALLLLSTSVFASGALEAIINENNGIEVAYDGKTMDLWNKPFVDNYEVYLPLREVLNNCGISNDQITYDNGAVHFSMYSPATNQDVTASVAVGEAGITFDVDQLNQYVMEYSYGERTTTHPVLLRNGVTYAPVGAFIRIKDLSIDLRDKTEEQCIDDFRYSRATRYQLLEPLEVRQYDGDGQFSVLLSLPLDVKGENKYDPNAYYEENEKVIIGTPEKQNESWVTYNEVNSCYYPQNPIKRIIVDEEGKVVAIALVQNQKHEALNRCDRDTFAGGGRGYFPPFGQTGGVVLAPDAQGGRQEKKTAVLFGENIQTENSNRIALYFYIPTYLMVQPY